MSNENSDKISLIHCRRLGSALARLDEISSGLARMIVRVNAGKYGRFLHIGLSQTRVLFIPAS